MQQHRGYEQSDSGYAYHGSSRRRRLRRRFRILRWALGGVTALLAGRLLWRLVQGLDRGASQAGGTILWLTATIIAVTLVVLLVSVVGWLIEWRMLTRPPALPPAENSEDGDPEGRMPSNQ
jgi:hypothetical protein